MTNNNIVTDKGQQGYVAVEPEIGTSNVKTLTASGDWGSGELWGAYGALDGAISGYTMIVAPDAKLDGVYGGRNIGTGNAAGNTVIIGRGATIGAAGVSAALSAVIAPMQRATPWNFKARQSMDTSKADVVETATMSSAIR